MCLVGKLLTDNQFNAEALKTTMKNVWRPVRGVIVKDLDKNLFAFQFFSHANKETVLTKDPSVQWKFAYPEAT